MKLECYIDVYILWKNNSMAIPEAGASPRFGVFDCDLVVLLDGVLEGAGLDMALLWCLLEASTKVKEKDRNYSESWRIYINFKSP